jgi:hypothetical protein
MPVPYIPLNPSVSLGQELKRDLRDLRLKLNELKEHRLTIDSMLTGLPGDVASYGDVVVQYGCATNAQAQVLRQAVVAAINNIHTSLTELITALR